MRILIANRGEIARRIIRTAERLSHETGAVFADPDREAPFVAEATTSVHLGPAELSASYLDPLRLLDAADEWTVVYESETEIAFERNREP